MRMRYERRIGSGSMSETPLINRPRASAAVLRDGGCEVLMVKHRRPDGTEYWQLPGGGALPGESLEDAALRELREETTLEGKISRFLFTIPYKYGPSTTFLVEVPSDARIALGGDPEEANSDTRKLAGVAWRSLADVRESPEIQELLCILGRTWPGDIL